GDGNLFGLRSRGGVDHGAHIGGGVAADGGALHVAHLQHDGVAAEAVADHLVGDGPHAVGPVPAEAGDCLVILAPQVHAAAVVLEGVVADDVVGAVGDAYP